MKKRSRKVSKSVAKVRKAAVSKVKKAVKLNGKGRNLLSKAKKRFNAMTKTSSKTLKNAKNKVIATEEEIVKYVKANPVKSISTVALVGLIAGFVGRYKK